MGGRTVGPEVACDLDQVYLAAEYDSGELRPRRLGRIATLEDISSEKSHERLSRGDQGIVPDIKVDTRAKPLAGWSGETVAEGLDGLRGRFARVACMSGGQAGAMPRRKI